MATDPDALDYTAGPEGDGWHFVEIRPRFAEEVGPWLERTADGRRISPVIVIDCGCGWQVQVTDNDDFITPWEALEITRRHYRAVPVGHEIHDHTLRHIGLDPAEFEARGVFVERYDEDWR